MTYRICVLAAGVVSVFMLCPLSAASATDSPSRCVAYAEFSSLTAGQTRSQIENAWDVTGVWDSAHSDPDHDAYLYPRCGRTVENHRNIVRITFARHTRQWTLAILKAHGTNLAVDVPF